MGVANSFLNGFHKMATMVLDFDRDSLSSGCPAAEPLDSLESLDSVSLDYDLFLASKRVAAVDSGFRLPASELNSLLFPFQRDISVWGIRRGRAGIFLDTGLGKTFVQLEIADQICRNTGGRFLLLTPLAVGRQTLMESSKFGIQAPVRICSSQAEADKFVGIVITNYEKLHKFDPAAFIGVGLDEASILKSLDGKTRNQIIDAFQQTPFRFAFTATPSPNDIMEIGSYAEFLGIMTRAQMLAMFFTHDGGDTAKWRLRGHAEKDFFKWLSTWCVMIRKPSDLGYCDEGYDLPPLRIHEHVIETGRIPAGFLFQVDAKTLGEQRQARRDTIPDRTIALSQLVIDSIKGKGYGLEEEIRRVETEEIRGGSGVQTTTLNAVGAGSREAKGVHEGVLPQDEGQAKAAKSRKTGQVQRKQTGAVQDGRSSTQGCSSESSGLAKAESAQTKVSEAHNLRNNAGSIQRVTGEARRSLCDLRIQRHIEQVDVSIGRSLPQNGSSSRPTVHELQSGNREAEGLSGDSRKGNPLPAERKWVVWCSLNAEQDEVKSLLGSYCASIEGATPDHRRIELHDAWAYGAVPILATKISLFGYGLNWQHCHDIAFLGLSHSYEDFYQAIRRCYRFGQKHPVDVHIFVSDRDGAILDNIKRKQLEADRLADGMIAAMAENSRKEVTSARQDKTEYLPLKKMDLSLWN